MKFSTKEDIEAPVAFVFAELSDFDGFERGAMRRGATVKRLDRRTEPGTGMSWALEFRWRGRDRKMVTDMTTYDPPHTMAFLAESAGFEMVLGLSFLEMSRKRTRLAIELEVKPRTLASRIMLQSLKLGKAKLTRKFVARVKMAAEEIEARHLKQQG
ncbi:SRPBCC family protein [Frigidibacter albus]|uniref:SRPBCC family protein n=1 Tax=Frigidibacter albus TaxID=1465486 RepID=A0A6L8VMU5_9RHOB|nr:SRPBCC family protein [Frigidibacter albus]MZQ90480.1 SRPBCC family protein [Frigidibacter albus]NBE32400.1 SRPBCC family protein [Frigidibacter albus]GGH59569.1 hypothetical protein GCM10011341_30980 [Frigidibacter albus]